MSLLFIKNNKSIIGSIFLCISVICLGMGFVVTMSNPTITELIPYGMGFLVSGFLGIVLILTDDQEEKK